MRITNARHGLAFGTLDLARPEENSPYELKAKAAGTGWSNADPVLTVVESLLADGEIVTIDRFGNRQPTIALKVKGVNSLVLAAAERDLRAQVGKRNTLTWIPPDEWGPPSVFDVITSWLEHVMDDQDELNLTRHYVLHLVCYPHVRSPGLTTVAATGAGTTPPAPTEELVTNADTTTGWTAINYGDAPPADGGNYVYTEDDDNKPMTLKYTLPAAEDYSANPYLVIDYLVAFHTLTFVKAGTLADPAELPILSDTSIGLGLRRVTADLSAVAANVEQIQIRVDPPEHFAASFFGVANVKVTNGVGGSGTTRQLFRSITVGGSERAQGAIHLQHEDALGEVLVWSGPAECSPPLRAYRTSGAGATGDTAMVSGSREEIGTTPMVVQVPVGTLPAGSYSIMVRAKAGTSAGERDFTVTAQTVIAGVDLGENLEVASTHDFADTTTWEIFEVGYLTLPITDTAPGAEAVVELSFAAAGGAVQLDEAWLFNNTDGVLTFVPGAMKNLWLTTPTVGQPFPKIWTGDEPDQSDARAAAAEGWGIHDLQPGRWSAFTVTTTAEDAAVTVEYYKRWHTHAAEVD